MSEWRCRKGRRTSREIQDWATGDLQEAWCFRVQLQTKDSRRQDTSVSSTATSPCTYTVRTAVYRQVCTVMWEIDPRLWDPLAWSSHTERHSKQCLAVRLIRFLDCSSNRVGSTTRTGYHIDNRDAICPFWWQLERVIAGINVIVYHIVPFVIRLANINALPKQSPRFLLNISRDLTFGCFSGNPLILIGYCQQAAARNGCNAACQYGVVKARFVRWCANHADCRAEHQNDDNQHDKQVSSFFDHIRFLLYSLACGDAIKRNVPTIAIYIFNVSHWHRGYNSCPWLTTTTVTFLGMAP